MKRIFFILSVLLMGAVGCTKSEPMDTLKSNLAQEGKIELIIKASAPGTLLATKAGDEMAETPKIKTIHLAVFGTKHYLNEYVLATPCDKDGNTVSSYANLNAETVEGEDTNVFYMKAILNATTDQRFIHIIANGPSYLDYETKEEDIMWNLKTSGNVGAYWAHVVLPNGEGGGTVAVNEDGTFKVDESGNYVPSDAVKTAFQTNGIRLIRNFAQVKLIPNKSDPHFTLTGFKVYNTSPEGYVAPFTREMVNDGYGENQPVFYDNYAELEKAVLEPENYKMQETFATPETPSSSDNFISVGSTATEASAFIFERSKTSDDNRPYIILKGTWKASSDATPVDSYYRVDFVDIDGNYLPLCRNYTYRITFDAMPKKGKSAPSADIIPSNANVSSLPGTQEQSDLSNGKTRLYVQYLEQTYVTKDEIYEFHYAYYPNAESDATTNDVTFALKGTDGGAITPIDKNGNTTTFANWASTATKVSDGTYYVQFKVNDPTNLTSMVTTEFTVTGQANAQTQKLYRDVKINLLPPQDFTVTASQNGQAINSPVTVTVTLPPNLPASMFPILLNIEDTAQALNPNETVATRQMPVEIGTSITGSEKQSYHYVRTVSRSEYNTNRAITCTFKRIKTNATTVYVKAKNFNDPTTNPFLTGTN